jgi:hypothetical protein
VEAAKAFRVNNIPVVAPATVFKKSLRSRMLRSIFPGAWRQAVLPPPGIVENKLFNQLRLLIELP